MKIARFIAGNGRPQYGVVDSDLIRPASGDIFDQVHPTGEALPINKIKFLPPVLPTKILALGINYRSHASELKLKLPKEPMFFYKPTSALIGALDAIEYPLQSKRVDYEAEMAVVIGKTARNVPVTRALEYALGYTCFNDVTARDIQSKDGALELVVSKSFDTFAPVGPWIETDVDPTDLLVECWVNEKLKQSARTSDLVFGVAEVISYISSIMTLCPGDIIATGTPAGIGPMSVGDIVSVRVEGLGTLENTLVSAPVRP